MEEFEIKFLEVDVPELEKKLVEIGAKKVGEYDYKITLFDYPDLRLDKKHSWLKLRTDGKETTLTYKQRIGVRSNNASIPDEGMKEIEIFVDDFKKTCELLLSIGFALKRNDKKRRIRYKKGKAVYDIDFYPKIPPYLEVESNSLQNAREAARKLGFNPDEALICSSQQVYKKYGITMDNYLSMKL